MSVVVIVPLIATTLLPIQAFVGPGTISIITVVAARCLADVKVDRAREEKVKTIVSYGRRTRPVDVSLHPHHLCGQRKSMEYMDENARRVVHIDRGAM